MFFFHAWDFANKKLRTSYLAESFFVKYLLQGIYFGMRFKKTQKKTWFLKLENKLVNYKLYVFWFVLVFF